MAKTPAPISVIREKLQSADAETRIVALVHAQAHGVAARPLATLVAKRLEDPHASVQWHVPGVFRAMGPAAADAVPTLIAQLALKVPDMIVERALSCLGCIGPEARDAVNPVLALSKKKALRGDALETLARIVPSDREDAVKAVLGGLLDADIIIAGDVGRALRHAPAWLVDRAVDAVIGEIATGRDKQRTRAAGATVDLGPLRPERLIPVVRALIERCDESSSPALLAVQRIGKPIDADLGRSIVMAATTKGPQQDRALETLREIGEQLRGTEAARLGGERLCSMIGKSRSLRTIGGAALALAAIAPSASGAVPILAAQIEKHVGSKSPPKWYELADCAEAIGALASAEQASRVHKLLDSAIAWSHRFLHRDESAVLDFQRSATRGLDLLDLLDAGKHRPRRARCADVESIDAEYDDNDTDAESERELPDFPTDAEPPSIEVATIRALDTSTKGAVATMLEMGREVVGAYEKLGPRASAQYVAEAVDRTVGSLRRARKSDFETTLSLGILWGDAVSRALAWPWKMWVVREGEALALVSPDESHVILPVVYMTAMFEPGRAVTALLLFNMLVMGKLPPSRKGALTIIQ